MSVHAVERRDRVLSYVNGVILHARQGNRKKQ